MRLAFEQLPYMASGLCYGIPGSTAPALAPYGKYLGAMTVSHRRLRSVVLVSDTSSTPMRCIRSPDMLPYVSSSAPPRTRSTDVSGARFGFSSLTGWVNYVAWDIPGRYGWLR